MFAKSNHLRLVVIGIVLCLVSAGCKEKKQEGPYQGELTTINPDDLCKRITQILKQTQDGRELSTELQGAWQIVHGILAFGEQFTVLHESVTVPALDYLLEGGTLQGWKLRPGKNGITALVEEGSALGQGHQDQWLGYLSQCGNSGIPLETPLIVGETSATVNDLLRQAQADLHAGQEATWTLMAFATYLQEDDKWETSNGETWDLSRVIEMELDADLHSSACGGSHRLYGLATAVNTYRSRHPEVGEHFPNHGTQQSIQSPPASIYHVVFSKQTVVFPHSFLHDQLRLLMFLQNLVQADIYLNFLLLHCLQNDFMSLGYYVLRTVW